MSAYPPTCACPCLLTHAYTHRLAQAWSVGSRVVSSQSGWTMEVHARTHRARAVRPGPGVGGAGIMYGCMHVRAKARMRAGNRRGMDSRGRHVCMQVRFVSNRAPTQPTPAPSPQVPPPPSPTSPTAPPSPAAPDQSSPAPTIASPAPTVCLCAYLYLYMCIHKCCGAGADESGQALVPVRRLCKPI